MIQFEYQAGKYNYSVSLIPGESITIHTKVNPDKAFEGPYFGRTEDLTLTFKPGDLADCDYNNFCHPGTIKSITEKAVTVIKPNGKPARMSHKLFSDHNFDFCSQFRKQVWENTAKYCKS